MPIDYDKDIESVIMLAVVCMLVRELERLQNIRCLLLTVEIDNCPTPPVERPAKGT